MLIGIVVPQKISVYKRANGDMIASEQASDV
jgi:hypothetical protein